MSGVLVPDASIVAKLFLRETESNLVSDLLDAANVVIAPHLITLETASAITRRQRMGGIDRAFAEKALSEARAFFAGASIALTPDIQLLERAEQIALDAAHPLKDCLYVALAEREGAEFVTADASLLARARPLFPFARAL